MIYQDNESAILLENNGRLSGDNRTKHTNIRCYFIEDAIEPGEANMECSSADKMQSDYFTTPP